ncbi:MULTISPECIES: helix-turn-helix domain-containing protein [unclassified Microbacterium]|uniref:helix-turn-helix domain-containing protein n=1 Tax=Microbacterium TaxID=33882 RepID=UPI003B9F2BCD
MTNRKDYLLEVTGARSARAIAVTSGIDPSTLNRQLNGTTSLTVETVVQVCRAYNLDMSQVFVGVGFITPEEADHLGRIHSLSEYTDLELAREIVRRLEAGEATADLTGELNVLPQTEDDIQIVDAPRKSEHALAADEGDVAADQPHAE